MNGDHISSEPHSQPPQRRPRGFAATAAASAASIPDGATPPGGRVKKEREKEKERTKLRERHRRAITSRMLAGLRQYGNFPLPARADINDVLTALARQAGWTVHPDGSTFRSSTPPPPPGTFSVRSAGSSLSNSSLKKCSVNALDCQPSVFKIDENLSPASLDSIVVSERDTNSEKYTSASTNNSSECLGADQLMHEIDPGDHGNGFAASPYVPVYVMLATGAINNFCHLVNPEGIRQELRHLKSLHVDGVAVDCWWGIVEGWAAQKYEWSGYRELFMIVREFQLKLQCYDKYSLQNLRNAALLRGHSIWARVPDNAGQYSSRPHETGFFCERGDYDNYYGRFFLRWYAQTLIDHVDNVLSLATLAFEDITIIVKIPQVYWWYKTPSHAAELTAGYYNSTNQDGYSPLFEVLKRYSVVPEFVFSGLQVPCQDEALADPEGLSWQVINSAWDRGLTVAGQNANPCYDREAYLRFVETAKPRNHPDRCHFVFFVYQQPSSPLTRGTACFSDLDYFVKCMHGELEP